VVGPSPPARLFVTRSLADPEKIARNYKKGLFNLIRCPGMLDLGQPMFDAIFSAAQFEHLRHARCGRAVRVARSESKLDSIFGENHLDLVSVCPERY
jgi:hypothetical protein